MMAVFFKTSVAMVILMVSLAHAQDNSTIERAHAHGDSSDERTCKVLQWRWGKKECKGHVAGEYEKENMDVCNALQGRWEKKTCKGNIDDAYEKEDGGICDTIQGRWDKKGCLGDVADAPVNGNKGVCNALQGRWEKKGCKGATTSTSETDIPGTPTDNYEGTPTDASKAILKDSSMDASKADNGLERMVIEDRLFVLRNKRGSSWWQAKEACNELHAQLPEPLSPRDNDGLVDFLTKHAKDAHYAWLGATDLDRAEGDYILTASGNPLTYSNWASGSPSGGNEHCAAIFLAWDNWKHPGYWNDLPCDYRKRQGAAVVCEMIA